MGKHVHNNVSLEKFIIASLCFGLCSKYMVGFIISQREMDMQNHHLSNLQLQLQLQNVIE